MKWRVGILAFWVLIVACLVWLVRCEMARENGVQVDIPEGQIFRGEFTTKYQVPEATRCFNYKGDWFCR